MKSITVFLHKAYLTRRVYFFEVSLNSYYDETKLILKLDLSKPIMILFLLSEIF